MTHCDISLIFTALMLAGCRVEAIQSVPTVIVQLSTPANDISAKLPDEREVGFNVFMRKTGKRVDGARVVGNASSATLHLPPNTDLLVRGSRVSISTGSMTACIAEGYLIFMPEARYSWTFEYTPNHAEPALTVCKSTVSRLSDSGEVVESIDLTARVLEEKSK